MHFTTSNDFLDKSKNCSRAMCSVLQENSIGFINLANPDILLIKSNSNHYQSELLPIPLFINIIFNPMPLHFLYGIIFLWVSRTGGKSPKSPNFKN